MRRLGNPHAAEGLDEALPLGPNARYDLDAMWGRRCSPATRILISGPRGTMLRPRSENADDASEPATPIRGPKEVHDCEWGRPYDLHRFCFVKVGIAISAVRRNRCRPIGRRCHLTIATAVRPDHATTTPLVWRRAQRLATCGATDADHGPAQARSRHWCSHTSRSTLRRRIHSEPTQPLVLHRRKSAHTLTALRPQELAAPPSVSCVCHDIDAEGRQELT